MIPIVGDVIRYIQNQRKQAAVNSAIKSAQDFYAYESDPGTNPNNDPGITRATNLARFNVATELFKAGVDPREFYGGQAAMQQQRFMEQDLPQLTAAQRVTASTGHDVSPVRMQNGVAFDRFNPQAPILGEAPSIQQRAQSQSMLDMARVGSEQARQGLYGEQVNTERARQGDLSASAALDQAKTGQISQRTGAMDQLLNDPSLSPVVKADLVNRKSLFKPQRVKVKQPDGSIIWMDATPNLSGGMDYNPAVDDAGKPLSIPPGTQPGERKTALEQNAQVYADTYEVPFEQGLELASADPQQRARMIKKLSQDVTQRRGLKKAAQKFAGRQQKLWQGAGEPPVPGAQWSPKVGGWVVKNGDRWQRVITGG